MSDLSANSNTLVVLSPTRGRGCKVFRLGADGSVEVQKYQSGIYFTPTCEQISNLRDLYSVIQKYSAQRDCCLIRGRLRDDIDPERLVRRKIRTPDNSDPNECAFEAQKNSWLMIDIDKLPLPDGLDVTTETDKAVGYAVSLLPEEFKGVSYAWQLSASCGVFDKNSISVHLFFWLSEPWSDEHLRLWGKSVNALGEQNLIDASVFRPVQIHYIADPVFHGVANPIQSSRLGFHQGKGDAVELQFDLPAYISSHSVATGRSIAGVGYEGKMSVLGDGPGGQGFNDVLVSAVASYVATEGGDEAETAREDLKVMSSNSGMAASA